MKLFSNRRKPLKIIPLQEQRAGGLDNPKYPQYHGVNFMTRNDNRQESANHKNTRPNCSNTQSKSTGDAIPLLTNQEQPTAHQIQSRNQLLPSCNIQPPRRPTEISPRISTPRREFQWGSKGSAEEKTKTSANTNSRREHHHRGCRLTPHRRMHHLRGCRVDTNAASAMP